MDRRIQVVLGEAEPGDGFLRFVLEGEGFDLVGLASSDEELDRVLEGARPTVIVLDPGISALAALRAKELGTGASIVTVWPEGVSAVLAEERVDPSDVVEALGPAVRKAATRATVPEAAPDAAAEIGRAIRAWRAAEPILTPATVPPPQPIELPRRGPRKVLVLAATWLLILTALTSIATAIPKVVESVGPPERSRWPAIEAPAPAPSPFPDPAAVGPPRSAANVGGLHASTPLTERRGRSCGRSDRADQIPMPAARSSARDMCRVLRSAAKADPAARAPRISAAPMPTIHRVASSQFRRRAPFTGSKALGDSISVHAMNASGGIKNRHPRPPRRPERLRP